jgi:hypothetical protein
MIMLAGHRKPGDTSAMDFEDTPRGLYLSLLKSCLLDSIYEGESYQGPFDPGIRNEGKDWPTRAHTMIGRLRLDNLQWCVETVLAEGVPGDLIETGVWRGGATIFMRAVLKAHGVKDRKIWVADSFEGLPDAGLFQIDDIFKALTVQARQQLVISLAEVRTNFERYGLLDEQVRFLPGWFQETLSAAPLDRLAILRLDGDLYESTIQALESLYAKVSLGGFVIVDDYNGLPPCRQAVDDFRGRLGLTEPIRNIDWTGVFWRKEVG